MENSKSTFSLQLFKVFALTFGDSVNSAAENIL